MEFIINNLILEQTVNIFFQKGFNKNNFLQDLNNKTLFLNKESLLVLAIHINAKPNKSLYVPSEPSHSLHTVLLCHDRVALMTRIRGVLYVNILHCFTGLRVLQ